MKSYKIFRKNRLLKLEQTNYKCETCDNDTKIVHHKDKDRVNNELSNLKVLCMKHHILLHPRSKGTFTSMSRHRCIVKINNYINYVLRHDICKENHPIIQVSKILIEFEKQILRERMGKDS